MAGFAAFLPRDPLLSSNPTRPESLPVRPQLGAGVLRHAPGDLPEVRLDAVLCEFGLNPGNVQPPQAGRQGCRDDSQEFRRAASDAFQVCRRTLDGDGISRGLRRGAARSSILSINGTRSATDSSV